ncbi:MAG: hypothetical protein ACOCTM_02450 [Bacteroidota bacterium]
MSYPIKRGPKTSRKDERDKKMYDEYKRMIRDEGEKGRLLPKSYFYEQLADKFFLSSTSVQNYIPRMIRKERNGKH